MTDDLDALEAELRGFRPRPPSPALRGRIAGRLTEAGPAPSSLRQRLALAGALIAAGVAFVVVLNVVGHGKSDPQKVPWVKADYRPAPPTVRAYRRALSQSPAALDALLDEQAVYTGQPATPTRPVTALAAGNRTFLSWRGDR